MCGSNAAAAEKGPEPAAAQNVVLLVWDGMRPDFVREETTPTLWQLSRNGVTFPNHHAVYPTATEVNGTALATGVYPRRSGLMGNWEYRPEIDARKPVSRETPDALRRGDELTGGKYLALPTLAERVQAAGFRTAVAGTKWGTVLQDRHQERRTKAARESLLFFGKGTVPDAGMQTLRRVLGAFPSEVQHPNHHQDSWTTTALTDVLWKEGVPRFSLLWLSDPDFTQHHTAPGSPAALAAMKHSDDRLATVLRALEQNGARDTTNVIVVSDHGFSTVVRSVDVVELLNGAGFTAVKEFVEKPNRGDILVAGNGGSVFFYVIERDPPTMARLVEWLQRSDFAGVLFSRTEIAGTFPLKEVQIDTPAAPDVVMGFRWSDAPNEYGVRGAIQADWRRKAGHGSHASFSRFDVNATCVAAGPGFRRDFTAPHPSGNVDIAPTVLRLLGLESKEKLDGRVLEETLRDGEFPRLEPHREITSAARDFENGRWEQRLQLWRIAEQTYYSEANGGFTAASPAPVQ